MANAASRRVALSSIAPLRTCTDAPHTRLQPVQDMAVDRGVRSSSGTAKPKRRLDGSIRRYLHKMRGTPICNHHHWFCGSVLSHHSNALSLAWRTLAAPWCCECGEVNAEAISKQRRRCSAANHHDFSASW
jgi:hypothetical protein